MPTKASARNHFMKTQEQLRKKYEALGMTEYQISEMYKFDLNVFNRDIAYGLHTQPLMPEEEDDDIDEGKNPLAKKFIESISVMPDTPMTAKYWWMDEIDDRVLLEKMKKLSLEELDLVDLVFQGYSQHEISEILGKSQSAVSQRMNTIRKKIKKFR